MAGSNRRAKTPGAKEMDGNGNANGHAGNRNDVVPGKSNTITMPTKPKKKTKQYSLYGVIFRLMTWYSFITIFFRCPATTELLTDSSPKLCKSYFETTSTLKPHLEPYYELYAGPYVDVARPYYNTLNQKVVAPATAFGVKYGGPRVAQAQAYGQTQWEKSLQPVITQYQKVAKGKYDKTLAPHINKANKVVAPYYGIAKTNAFQTYYGHILPTYTTVQPYAIQGYGLASGFVVSTAVPYSQWAWTKGGIFLQRTVFPKLRILYGENVEPQLMRIGERLGRYRDGQKLKAAVGTVDSSSLSTFASSTYSSIASLIDSTHVTSTATTSSQVVEESAQPTPVGEKDARANAQKIVAEDLKTWQEKFSKAADVGSEELEIRVTEITNKMIQSQAQKVGKALNIQLEETVKSSFNALKSDIISLVKDSSATEAKEESLGNAIRKAGVSIKDKAQSIRAWRETFNHELNQLVGSAGKETFQIIDGIRDLGLQEVGMRWAWTDGITHKDWSKYHALKAKFDEWRLDVEQVVKQHPGIANARAAADEVENRAMDIAGEAASELIRLREIGKSKIATEDASDDFTNPVMPAVIANAGQNIMSKVSEASEAVVGTSQGTMESVVSSAQRIASSLSSSVIGAPQGSAESAVPVGISGASSIIEQASVIGTSQGTIESVASVVSSSASSLSDMASSSISSLSSSVSSSVSESASVGSVSVSSAASSGSSTASKKVWGGAEAQFVEAKQIVFEDIIEDSDEDTFSEKIQNMVSLAGDELADITRAVSEALIEPTRIDGTVATVTVLASEKYTSALSAASLALYGTEQDVIQSVTSAAVDRYVEAVAAASSIIYGTPTPATQAILNAATSAIYGTPAPAAQSIAAHVQALASSRLSEGVAAASFQYKNAKSYLSAVETKDAAKQGLSQQMQNQYYAGIGMAYARYSDFLSAASSAVIPIQTPTPAYQAALSSASASYANIVSAASVQMADILASVSSLGSAATPTTGLTDAAFSGYSAVVSDASVAYASLSSAAVEQANLGASGVSSAAIGGEIPWTESAASAASENWEALVTKASTQIYGQPTPYFITRQLLSDAKEYAESATDVVASQYTAVASLISELVAGKEPVFTESVYARFSSAYYTGAGEAVASASSYASEVYASATSVVGSVFTPPPALEAILDAASSQVNDAVESASIQFYGRQKGTYEQATESAASVYSSAASAASERIYGTQTGYAEAAQSSISDAAASAQIAISEAIYGTLTGNIESVTNVIADTLSSASSIVAENFAAASAKASSGIYGPEQGAVESAQARLSEAVVSAKLRLAEFASVAGERAANTVSKATAGVEDMASSITEAVSEATKYVKDEL
ncbi:hypothetical protein BJ878DRAFT_513517 [Calycina marina]|uniref:Uncharacterized protein n=1 Tax=Calycina marina TaxID=1763456 RepID=A0A9P7YZT0_9HELO|nr:hypothetical protein BJ878DRAFT_513517 [Calycina marina]